jgi:hypothetical protein
MMTNGCIHVCKDIEQAQDTVTGIVSASKFTTVFCFFSRAHKRRNLARKDRTTLCNINAASTRLSELGTVIPPPSQFEPAVCACAAMQAAVAATDLYWPLPRINTGAQEVPVEPGELAGLTTPPLFGCCCLDFCHCAAW